MNNETKNRIDQVLESLDSSQRIPAPDFFYTRLKARMQKEMESGKPGVSVLRPVYAFAFLVLVLIINLSVILKSTDTPERAISDTEVAQSIAVEYSINDNNNLYDLTLDQ